MSSLHRAVPVGPQLMQVLSLLYRAGQPVLLEGNTGVGKSTLLEQLAEHLTEELGEPVGLVVRDLSIMEPVDLSGMPRVEDEVVHYSVPAFLPRAGRGILIFEELNRAPRYLQAPCLQLLTARSFNDYRLPDGWLPMAAINPSDDPAYSGTEVLDEALVTRFCYLRVRADKRAWLSWAKTKKIDRRIRAFVGDTPDIFSLPHSNPRAWEYVHELVGAAGDAVRFETVMPALTGLVGRELAAGFWEYLSGNLTSGAVPEVDDIIDDPAKIMRKLRAWGMKQSTGNFEALKDKILLWLQDPDHEAEIRQEPADLENLRKVVTKLPADMRRMIHDEYPWINADKGAA